MGAVLPCGQRHGIGVKLGKTTLESYLRAVRRRLWVRGLADPGTLEEIEGHLLESIQAGLQQGLTREQAESEALKRFGTVDGIVAAYENERTNSMQKVFVALGIAAGCFIAYVDTRPNWDDTGITAGLLLLSAGLLTLLGYRRPWLMALAVGIWIPLYYIYRSHDWAMLIVLVIPLIGAYAGRAANLVIRMVFRPA